MNKREDGMFDQKQIVKQSRGIYDVAMPL
jgi:hypothetical protein